MLEQLLNEFESSGAADQMKKTAEARAAKADPLKGPKWPLQKADPLKGLKQPFLQDEARRSRAATATEVTESAGIKPIEVFLDLHRERYVGRKAGEIYSIAEVRADKAGKFRRVGE
jgi:hypothetical protein